MEKERNSLIEEMLPENILAALDKTIVSDDNLELVETSHALRVLLFKHELEVATSLKPKIFPAPITAQIEFTQKCNMRCTFCYNYSESKNPDTLSLSEMEQVCAQLRDLNVGELIISGGEPLLFPQHLQVVFDCFSGSGTVIHLLTNGVLLSKEILSVLVKNNLRTIQVSLDGGDPGIHDKQRGLHGAWLRAYEGIVLAKDLGLNTIVSFTLTAANAATIDDLIDVCYLAGVEMVNIGDVIAFGRALDWLPGNMCTDEQYDHVFEKVLRKQETYQNAISLKFAPNMVFFIAKLRFSGHSTLIVRGNGDVIPHCVLSEVVVGNVKTEPIKDIWSNLLSNISQSEVLVNILNSFEIFPTPKYKLLRARRRGL